MQTSDPSQRPASFEYRYRLYLDESGDHVYRKTTELSHRFLCLLGCWFQNPAYLRFHQALETLKSNYLPHHPDDPVILHREDMINARKRFKTLRDPEKRAAFDTDLLKVIAEADFRLVGVVVDKQSLKARYSETAGHPYHIGLGFLLQRYAGYLNHLNRVGDVMAESRGGTEDRLLKDSYKFVYQRGIWGVTSGHYFQAALTSGEIKLKQKRTNIAGLQLADILAHPIKMFILQNYGLYQEELAPFAQRILKSIEPKFNRHLYDGRLEGYGIVLYPKNKRASSETLLRSPMRAIHLRWNGLLIF